MENNNQTPTRHQVIENAGIRYLQTQGLFRPSTTQNQGSPEDENNQTQDENNQTLTHHRVIQNAGIEYLSSFNNPRT